MSGLPQGISPLVSFSASELALYDKGPVVSALVASGLTKRQSEIMALLIDGKRNKEIASDLCVSCKTVRFHLTSIFKSFKVKNRNQAVIKAYQLIPKK